MNDPVNISDILADMTAQLAEEISRNSNSHPAMVGIHTGGVWIAEHLHRQLDIDEPLGSLDISFYRDDFTRIGMNPVVKPSQLPFSIDDRHIILVDDVLHTGRTIRAALNELFDYGRPASIILATLIERGGRELPIQANVVGRHIDLNPGEHIKLSGPDPLALEVQKTA
ncbi:MAG: bifunctional pyr operon transcriptional regulator/uracil phosphoribosyltransferase PyrR [Gammaproteobacteria bacterium]|nr:MAG: bifunctional pyr operon transcriptional regulator/uracil phosphoribosyltransferase PyrR [Gammaproteobacteria bacterium]HDN69502.1 bifunctional pyr operon transcriptional regulator/uracil phosphoribosyltransferase PyrR [Gammaproteobacteria bacterium]